VIFGFPRVALSPGLILLAGYHDLLFSVPLGDCPFGFRCLLPLISVALIMRLKPISRIYWFPLWPGFLKLAAFYRAALIILKPTGCALSIIFTLLYVSLNGRWPCCSINCVYSSAIYCIAPLQLYHKSGHCYSMPGTIVALLLRHDLSYMLRPPSLLFPDIGFPLPDPLYRPLTSTSFDAPASIIVDVASS